MTKQTSAAGQASPESCVLNPERQAPSLKPQASRLPSQPSGFTMVEIVIAMAIFAIGFVAVAAIFPVALTLQRETVDDVTAQQVGRNAEAIYTGKGVSAATSGNYTVLRFPESADASYPSLSPDWNDRLVHSLHEVESAASTNAQILVNQLTPSDRSYPSTTTSINARGSFWVPLVQGSDSDGDNISDNLKTFVFVMVRRDNETFPAKTPAVSSASNNDGYANPNDPSSVPGVYRARVSIDTDPDLGQAFKLTDGNLISDFKPGDWILDENGVTYRIKSVDSGQKLLGVGGFILPHSDANLATMPTKIWYAKPSAAGKPSPTRRIVSVDPTASSGTSTPPPPPPPPPPPAFDPVEAIIDNAPQNSLIQGGSLSPAIGLNFTAVGTWTNGTSGGRLGNHHWSALGIGADKVTFTFSNLPAGTYRLWATWLTHTNRATNTPFIIRENSTVIDTQLINQETMTVDVNYSGANWQVLNTYTIAGGSLSVEINDNANEYVVGDAIYLKRLP